jgi:hypothetical protein
MQRYSNTKMFKAIIQSLDIQCRNAKTVVVKTIRTPFFILKNLFTDQKNSKVVHIVRDPRPTIMSQNKEQILFFPMTSYLTLIFQRYSKKINSNIYKFA